MDKKHGFQWLILTGLYLFGAGLAISHVPLQFGAVIALIGVIGHRMTSESLRFNGNVLFAIWGFYVCWNLLSAAISVRPLHSLWAVIDNEWPVLIMFVLYWGIRDSAQLERLLKVAFVASAAAFLYSVFQFLTGRVLHRSLALTPIDESMFRAVGFYGAALSFAAYGLVIFFLSASFLSERKSSERLRWLPIPILAFLGLFSTFARSVWLSAFAIIPFLGFTKSRRAGWRMLAILAVAISLTSLAVPQIRDRIASIFTTTGNETRIHLWKSTLRIVEAYPLFGVGQDNFDYHFPLFRVEGFYDATDHPHNDYLNALVGGGIPAGLAFVAMWVLALWRGWSAMQRKTDAILHSTAVGATLSLAGLLIGSSFQNYYGTFVNCWLWWFVVGLILVADRLGSEQDQMIS